MDIIFNRLYDDSRFVRNTMVLEKMQKPLESYKSTMAFQDTFTIFIINRINPSQVTITFPTVKSSNYYGDFVLFLTVENYQTVDDIIIFFSSNSGPNLNIIEFDENIPFLFYFRYAKGEIMRPGRFLYPSAIQQFLKQNTENSLIGCRLYLEDDKSPDKIDLNTIHLVLKDSNDNTILNTIFQDPSTGYVLIREEEDQNLRRNHISSNEQHPTFPKIKND